MTDSACVFFRKSVMGIIKCINIKYIIQNGTNMIKAVLWITSLILYWVIVNPNFFLKNPNIYIKSDVGLQEYFTAYILYATHKRHPLLWPIDDIYLQCYLI